MPEVTLKKNESFESLMRRWKKSVEKADIMKEVRKREFYEKPSSVRKRAKAAARKRLQKQIAEARPQRQGRL